MRFLFLLLSFSPCHVGILYCLASQGMGMKQQPLEELMIMTTTTTSPSTASSIGISTRPPPPQVAERKARPQKEALNCPRCNSTNTKFCYYNNYSLTQPRYFCKTCRRYWTEGGSLRNVPVGGGSRKNKKHSSSSSSSSSKNLPLSCQGLTNPPPAQPLPISLANNQSSRSYQGQDLNLAFPAASHSLPECGGGGGMSAMELLRSGMSARGLGPLVSMPMPMPMVPESGLVYGAGFGLQELRPSAIKFPLDAGYESMQLFPFGEFKQVAVKASEVEESRVQGGEPPMFWNGMMGGSGGGGGGGGSW